MTTRGWVNFVMPCILLFLAAFMLWCKHLSKGRPLEVFKVTSPPNRHAVEQLISLQEAISQFEMLVQAGNIILLKLRAIIFASFPQVGSYYFRIDFIYLIFCSMINYH